MQQLVLYIDTTSNRLVAGLTNTVVVQPTSLAFYYGDTLSIQVFLLKPSGVVNNLNVPPWTSIPNAGLTLEMFLDDGKIGGTIYTSQIVWTLNADGISFSATLPMLTAALATLIGTATNAAAYLKIGYLSGGLPTTVFSQQINVNVGLPTNAVPVPAPGQTALSVEVAKTLFLQIAMPAGQGILLTSAAGKKFLLFAQDNAVDGSASVVAPQQP